MTSLPIVRRELRVASRRSSTYRMRIAVAASAIAIGAAFLITNSVLPGIEIGKTLFWSLAGLSIVYCFLIGRLTTADCISEEKRNGTLGFLFLTDLKGVDIVLGKVVATSLSGFYGLLAVFPVLAVPLLLGGMTNGEFWRMILVLVCTFFLSLGIGIFTSSLSRDFQRALSANFLALLAITCVPAAITFLFKWNTGQFLLNGSLLLICPGYTFYLCQDTVYGGNVQPFWQSVSFLVALTFLLLAVTSWIVPRSWKDKSKPADPDKASAESRTAPQKTRERRRRLLDRNAYGWLASRSRWKSVHVWIFLSCGAAWWMIGWMNFGSTWLDGSVAVAFVLLLNGTLKFWITLEAGHRLFEDKHGGALELLLTTPMDAGQIVKGQFMALRRQFLGPMIVVLLVEVTLMLTLLDRSYGDQTFWIWIAGMTMLLVDSVALAVTSMASSLTSPNRHKATLGTVFRLLVVPWLAFGLTVIFLGIMHSLLSTTGEPLTWRTYLVVWIMIGILFDLYFGVRSARMLSILFYELAGRQDQIRPRRSLFDRINALFRSNVTKPEHSGTDRDVLTQRSRVPAFRRWRRGIAGVALMVILGLVVFRPWTDSNPPPVVLKVPAGGVTQIFPCDQSAFLIPPDGSLWQWGVVSRQPEVRAPIPIRIGTDTNWLSAAGIRRQFIGIKTDGTLWQWGVGARLNRFPTQVGTDTDWAGAVAGMTHFLALKSDGSLWAWGQNGQSQLGIQSTAIQHDPVRVNFEFDWTTIAASGTTSYALKKDGTLWTWGHRVWFPAGGGAVSQQRIVRPEQFNSESNWVGFFNGTLDLVQNSRGELWMPRGPVDANLSAVETCTLRARSENGVAIALGVTFEPKLGPALLKVRDDGKLYSCLLETINDRRHTYGDWIVFDDEQEWISVVGHPSVTMGTTADGTIWTWGVDPGYPETLEFRSRLRVLQNELLSFFGARPKRVNAANVPKLQKTPRPLMRVEAID